MLVGMNGHLDPSVHADGLRYSGILVEGLQVQGRGKSEGRHDVSQMHPLKTVIPQLLRGGENPNHPTIHFYSLHK